MLDITFSKDSPRVVTIDMGVYGVIKSPFWRFMLFGAICGLMVLCSYYGLMYGAYHLLVYPTLANWSHPVALTFCIVTAVLLAFARVEYEIMMAIVVIITSGMVLPPATVLLIFTPYLIRLFFWGLPMSEKVEIIRKWSNGTLTKWID